MIEDGSKTGPAALTRRALLGRSLAVTATMLLAACGRGAGAPSIGDAVADGSAAGGLDDVRVRVWRDPG